VENVDAQLDLHRALQQRRKNVLAEISLVGIDLEAARSAFESAEIRLTSVRTRDLELLQEIEGITLDMWRLEWKLGRSLDVEGRSLTDDAPPTSRSSHHDQDIVVYDYHGDFPPGTVGAFCTLEGKEMGKERSM